MCVLVGKQKRNETTNIRNCRKCGKRLRNGGTTRANGKNTSREVDGSSAGGRHQTNDPLTKISFKRGGFEQLQLYRQPDLV